MTQCQTCDRVLDNPEDWLSLSCGEECLSCAIRTQQYVPSNDQFGWPWFLLAAVAGAFVLAILIP